ncbi:hypothetical protein PCANC_00323 [Puccinia coronata f. sp. avenae]|uniref:Uncharacterized protein n=1 Tax=Puccinia coronata f. sp. avenae TaxID=200324 RepID=A0A2N5S6I7_9BASI|nr:hypothetical protein PCANC_21841 [Puccinia coronata f. sp. avenae]PLW11395.1 hypothetical protein PCASD_21219 [Puccinia coronata f. sp. avenae]PLW45801.1 hypothetical protein PCASD_04798 [Puccinia coronata f. sp. avenae]PLW58787.1 hypothetical protein PCANC_00323 [Puccinia coronata f. sp. avenae]
MLSLAKEHLVKNLSQVISRPSLVRGALGRASAAMLELTCELGILRVGESNGWRDEFVKSKRRKLWFTSRPAGLRATLRAGERWTSNLGFGTSISEDDSPLGISQWASETDAGLSHLMGKDGKSSSWSEELSAPVLEQEDQ